MISQKLSLCYLASLCLVSCSGDDNDSTPKEDTTPTKVAIADVPIADAGLRGCVDRMANTYNLQWAEELTYLDCTYWGYLTRLREARDIAEGKSKTSLHGIIELSGLEYFTNLEKLLLEGNYYKSIDVGALKNLHWLSIRNSFVSELDVSQNTMLEFLNIEGTAVKYLDLTQQTQLKEFRAGKYDEDFVDIQDEEMQLLEDAFDLDLEEFVRPLTLVALATDADPEVLEASSSEISGLDTRSLRVFSGVMNNSDGFLQAVNLDSFSGIINELGADLDLTPYLNLERFILHDSQLEELVIPDGLSSLHITGRLKNLSASSDADLQSLGLHSVEKQSAVPSDINLSTFRDTLHNLSFTNYQFPRGSADFSNLNNLEVLTLNNSAPEIIMTIPTSLQTLNLIGDVGRPFFGDDSRVTHITMDGVPDQVCDMTRFDIALLSDLVINNCESSSIDLSGVPNLELLRLLGGNIESIDVTQVPNIETLVLNDQKLLEVNIDALSPNIERVYFSATGNRFSDDEKLNLQEAAEGLFNRVEL